MNDEVIRSSGLSGKAQVKPAASKGVYATDKKDTISAVEGRKVIDIRFGGSAVKKMPVPKHSPLYTPTQDSEPAVRPQRVAIVFRRKLGHDFTDRLTSVMAETQKIRDRLDALPEAV